MRMMRFVLPVVIVVVLLGFFKKSLGLEKGYSSTRQSESTALYNQKLEKPLTQAQNTQYQLLVQKLRCIVCYNQNLSESQAPLAMAIKQWLKIQIVQGNTEADIISLMKKQYGEVIIYDPPFHRGTALLWAGPFLLLMGVLGLIKKYFLSSGKYV